jgi:DNA-binding response OmpR family regulator
MRVFIVEDEKKIANILVQGLSEEGYTVEATIDREVVLEAVRTKTAACIVLDLMLPKYDGVDLLKQVRIIDSTVPVIVVSAKADLSVRVEAFDAGANDYLTKPFEFEELCARIRALLRVRKQNQIILSCEDLVLDTRSHEVARGDKVLELSNKEYALLEYLVMNQGMVMSRKQILTYVWKLDYDPATNVVDVYINYLRKKIDEGQDKKLIHTVRGHGYCIGTPENEKS